MKLRMLETGKNEWVIDEMIKYNNILYMELRL